MDREEVLSKLSIRLTHLIESRDDELNAQLDAVRRSLRGNADQAELHRISERLARRLLRNEAAAPEPPAALQTFCAEFAGNLKALELDRAPRAQLHKLAEQLAGAAQLEEQLELLRKTFEVLRQATAAAGAPTPKKKGSATGLLGWLDKKGNGDHPEIEVFLAKSTRLIDQTLDHLDVLNGNTADTKALREQLTPPGSVESVGAALEQVIVLLGEHSTRIEEERATTQDFLGKLRERLSTVEEAIISVIADGDESLERAVNLESEVGANVQVIGEAVREDDLDTLKRTVEHGLANLTSKVTQYLAAERESHHKSRKRVEDLNRKVREMEEQARDLRGQIKDRQDLAVKDALTGVYNRAGYEQRIAEEFARSLRAKTPLSLVFVDCNKFKQINDTYGHAAGDIVLTKVASTLATRARASDIVARYGGDEFVAVLPDTAADGAAHFARDACDNILKAGFNANGQPLEVSISCGITQAREGDTPETALHRADEAMYRAKKAADPKIVVV
ncbi:MAG: diguanylate cyclase [Halioglobus sp.]|nr:diguanylate cyclase [Halioglobus sp.]